ncbi:glycerophosphoryl diester phosphodiesterase [Diaminobutyricimonas aerilata]|uniref:Glycerophosphoryl diester phosphodiesterase n=1 Tax=Diaminobutyricimonas aerilata TaxID=1162967 RepID=A0A2M9CJS3_9MICO|nr:glycerophosphodiester phosphodiesterase [Diaminobutyricimonas aerilata]PJJ72153.1 glycerophosphoryl diester phosphodiesterase [Diaminobutyricimonas aerilata]
MAAPLPPRTDHPFFSGTTPRILAHRGLALRVPENTLPAFRAAWDAGARYIETDVHASRDGVAIISHDADLRRLTSRRERVAELTARELAAIDLGGSGFCTLAEALEALPDARFNIDVKAHEAARPAGDAIRAAGAEHRVLVSAFDERRRRAALAAAPGVATSGSSLVVARAVLAWRLGMRVTLGRVLADVHALQVPERTSGIRVVTPESVRAFHAAGVEVHVWTVNDVATMRRLLEWGVDGIVTDRADLAIDLVASR